ncbi:hypothetical protein VIBNISOn1_1190039 [Vibrio nigripulchritudo SOn1]|uniref:Uncharacterized protein n=1 Tax=Vibrio nigripulchritudo SOn1 TaxID=1238450 RepID=A0AAV2VJP5_9VIBR|nr:hypothetical protein VIBNISOn1_1190039 [Vibrio nigripulchritudo SOn1]
MILFTSRAAYFSHDSYSHVTPRLVTTYQESHVNKLKDK